MGEVTVSGVSCLDAYDSVTGMKGGSRCLVNCKEFYSCKTCPPYSFLATELLRVPGLWAPKVICKNVYMASFSIEVRLTGGKNSTRTEGWRVEREDSSPSSQVCSPEMTSVQFLCNLLEIA